MEEENQKAKPVPGHNLVSQVKDRNNSLKKIFPYVLETLAVFGAFWFGFLYYEFVSQTGNFYALLAVLGFYIIFSGFITLMTKELNRRILIAFLEVLAILLPFYSWPFTSLLLIGVILMGFIFWGISRSRHELQSVAEIKFRRAAQLHYGKLLTGLTIAAILLYIPKWSASSLFLSQKNFDVSLNSVSLIISRLYPEVQFTPTSTLQTVAESIVVSKLQSTPEFKNMTVDQKTIVVKQNVNEFLSSLKNNLGNNTQNSDTISKVIYQNITSRLQDWKTKFGDPFMVVWALIMFFLVRSFGSIVSGISLIIGYGLYELFLMWKLIRIGEVTRVAQTLEYVEE